MKKYKHICSFGSMCSVALFLRENGFRDGATIFDWLRSNMKSNIELVKNNFSNLLNPHYLKQNYFDHPEIVDNTFYDISLSHLFDETTSFKKNIKRVTKITRSRIKRFYNFVKDGPTLLIYYCYEPNDFAWINSNIDKIINFCESLHIDLCIVTNFEFQAEFPLTSFVIPFNTTHEPFGLRVTFPFDNNCALKKYLLERYDQTKINKNLAHKENRGSLIYRLFRKIRKKKKIVKLNIGDLEVNRYE